MEIVYLLRELGIRPQLKGYPMLIDAVEIIMNKPTIAITKDLYPIISSKYSTSPSKVERNIRHAIETGWNVADNPIKKRVFRTNIKSYPTNAEFICTLADSLKRGLLDD